MSLFSRLCPVAAALAAMIPAASCATSADGGGYHPGAGSGSGSGSSGAGAGSGMGDDSGGFGHLGTGDTGAPRAMRCDDAGHCTCFNIASIGYGGATGALAGHGGTDNTAAFATYLNTQSSSMVAQVGCGTDTGCTSPAKPTLTADFLAQYDVIIFQWLVNSIQPDPSIQGAFEGSGYWTFSPSELDALKTWVNGGGGVIVLSGYDALPGELGPTNQVVQALTDMSYSTTDTYGMTQTSPAEQCLGYSDPVTGWVQTSPLGQHLTEVGGFHGRAINTGPKSIVDCTSSTYGVCAAHEDVGQGHVYVFTDEWVTYTSQWFAPTASPNCVADAAPGPGMYPAVQVVYQTPQFWYNAISYAAQATQCKFMLNGTTM